MITMFNNITLRTWSTAIDDQFELTTAYIDDNCFNNTTLTTLSTEIDNQFESTTTYIDEKITEQLYRSRSRSIKEWRIYPRSIKITSRLNHWHTLCNLLMINLWSTYSTYDLLMQIMFTCMTYDLLMMYLWFTYDLLLIYLYFTYILLMIYLYYLWLTYANHVHLYHLWFTYDLLMMYIWTS